MPFTSRHGARLLALLCVLVALVADAGYRTPHLDLRPPIESPVGREPIQFATPGPIPFLYPCTDVAADCVSPAARRKSGSDRVVFCTAVSGLPSWVAVEDFRSAARTAAAEWNDAEAAVTIAYIGDCDDASRWEFRDGVNEIGWDEGRLLRSDVLAETWIDVDPIALGTRRVIHETDIVLNRAAMLAISCLRPVIEHEFGHSLGLGHSPNPGQIMYATLARGSDGECRSHLQENERAALQALYGVNRSPSVHIEALPSNDAKIRLRALATDPDGDPLQITWRNGTWHIVGTAEELTVSDPTIMIVVAAEDPFGLRATDAVLINEDGK